MASLTGIPSAGPKADEEEWPYRDPGQREWIPQPQTALELSIDWVDKDEQVGTIYLPDGTEYEVWADPIPFGFARYLEETYEDTD